MSSFWLYGLVLQAMRAYGEFKKWLVQFREDLRAAEELKEEEVGEYGRGLLIWRVKEMQKLLDDARVLAKEWEVEIPGKWTESAQEVLDDVKRKDGKTIPVERLVRY